MDFTRLEDIVRIQDEFLQKLSRSQPVATKGADVSELMTRDRTAAVEGLKRRLEELRAGRQTAIRRFDDEIARHEEALANLGDVTPPKSTEVRPRARRQKKTS